MDFLRQSQLPNKPRPPQGAQSSMGNFPTLQAYQQQQDAFVQQHLRNQAQYNQGLQSGQSPQRVPVMEAWKQAGENIQSGQYQGNPFQTGNVDALMGMFGQYGIQAPQGFRDQLLQNLGQQSAPPMYQPQPAMGYPGGPSNDFIPKFTDPTTGLPYGQQPQMTYPGGPMQPPVNPPAPAVDSFEAHMASWTPPKAPAWGWGSPQQQQDAERQSRVEHMQNYKAPAVAPGQAQPMPPRQQVMPTPPSTLPGWPSNDPIPKFTNPATGLPYGQPVTDRPVGPNGEYWPAFRSQPPSMQPAAPPQMTYPGGPMPPMAPGYGGRIGLPPGSMVTMDFRDRDGDMTDDRNQLGPGQSPPASYSQPPQAPAAPKPSDQWSYPLLPGHTRGPSGEQIMSSDARQAEIRRREQESGLTYVTRQDGKGGSWVRATKPNPKASISLNPEQAAGMKQYMESRQASRAQPTPPRTQGTPYRGRRR